MVLWSLPTRGSVFFQKSTDHQHHDGRLDGRQARRFGIPALRTDAQLPVTIGATGVLRCSRPFSCTSDRSHGGERN